MLRNAHSRCLSGVALLAILWIVDGGAAWAQAPSQDLADYVVLGVHKVRLKNDAAVSGGDVGVVAAGGELRFGRDVRLGDDTSAVGDRVHFRRGASVCRLFANAVHGRDFEVRCSGPTAWSPPLLVLPALPAFVPGTGDVDIERGASATLSPGQYGRVQIGNDAIVTLPGGVYELSGASMPRGRSGSSRAPGGRGQVLGGPLRRSRTRSSYSARS